MIHETYEYDFSWTLNYRRIISNNPCSDYPWPTCSYFESLHNIKTTVLCVPELVNTGQFPNQIHIQNQAAQNKMITSRRLSASVQAFAAFSGNQPHKSKFVASLQSSTLIQSLAFQNRHNSKNSALYIYKRDSNSTGPNQIWNLTGSLSVAMIKRNTVEFRSVKFLRVWVASQ